MRTLLHPVRLPLVLLSALVLAACGGDGGGAADEGAIDDAGSASVAAPADDASASAAPADPPTPAQPRGPAAGAGRQAAEPTAADSAAAAKEDVSPEWKQRERQMGSYADCMRQAREVQGAARQRLERACGNLPTAPKP